MLNTIRIMVAEWLLNVALTVAPKNADGARLARAIRDYTDECRKAA